MVGDADVIIDIEHGRQSAADLLAIIHIHAAIGPFGHDLHGAAVLRRDFDAHQPEADAFNGRFHHARHTGGDAGFFNQTGFDRLCHCFSQ